MIKVFGTNSCINCIKLKNLLDSKKVNYTYYNIRESDGLAELAISGLADELEVPIVANDNGKLDLDTFVEKLNNM